MMTKIIARVIKQSSVCGWFTCLTLSAAAPWVLLRQGTTALKRKISCKFNMRRSPGSWKTISTSINIQQLHQGWSPASPSLSAALELLSPVPALPWQFLQHFPFSETASPFTGMEILKYNIMISWDITCQVTLTVQDAGLRKGFLGHWSQFWAPRGSDRIHTWIRAGNIHHTFTQAHPTSTEILPLSLVRGSLWISELCKLKEKRGRAHPGPREEGMLDENAQVSSEGVACADDSVYQLHGLESLPVHSTKASYP